MGSGSQTGRSMNSEEILFPRASFSPGGPDVHRHHRPHALLGRRLPTRLQELLQPARHHGEHHVVHGASELGPDRVDRGKRHAHDLKPALRPDRVVQARVRGGADLLARDHLESRGRGPERVARVHHAVHPCLRGTRDRVHRQQPGPRAHDPSQWVCRPAAAVLVRILRAGLVGRQSRSARSAAGTPRLCVEDQVADVHRPDAVDHAVVGLGGERPAPVLEALDDHHFPKRTQAVQALGEEGRGPVLQLGAPAGLRERRARYLPGEIERRVRLPLGPREPAGVRLREPLAVSRELAESLREMSAQLLGRRCPSRLHAVEDHDRPDVHVGALVGLLELEERGVKRCQSAAHDRIPSPDGIVRPTAGLPVGPLHAPSRPAGI